MKNVVSGFLLLLAAGGALAESNHYVLPHGANKFVQVCSSCATVQEVRKERREGEGGAVGIVAGAAAGGLLGNQIGKGNGNTVATVAGVVAGGFAGNEVQKRVTRKDVWVTRVRMRDGSERSFEQESEPKWGPGTVVRVKKDNLARL